MAQNRNICMILGRGLDSWCNAAASVHLVPTLTLSCSFLWRSQTKVVKQQTHTHRQGTKPKHLPSECEWTASWSHLSHLIHGCLLSHLIYFFCCINSDEFPTQMAAETWCPKCRGIQNNQHSSEYWLHYKAFLPLSISQDVAWIMQLTNAPSTHWRTAQYCKCNFVIYAETPARKKNMNRIFCGQSTLLLRMPVIQMRELSDFAKPQN